jgi:hypothetical protein
MLDEVTMEASSAPNWQLLVTFSRCRYHCHSRGSRLSAGCQYCYHHSGSSPMHPTSSHGLSAGLTITGKSPHQQLLFRLAMPVHRQTHSSMMPLFAVHSPQPLMRLATVSRPGPRPVQSVRTSVYALMHQTLVPQSQQVSWVLKRRFELIRLCSPLPRAIALLLPTPARRPDLPTRVPAPAILDSNHLHVGSLWCNRRLPADVISYGMVSRVLPLGCSTASD